MILFKGREIHLKKSPLLSSSAVAGIWGLLPAPRSQQKISSFHPPESVLGEDTALAATPCQGAETVGVVGYPSDKGTVLEKGGTMYEAWGEAIWDLEKTGGMLSHSVSTTGGMDPQQALLIVKIVSRLTTLKRAARRPVASERHPQGHSWRRSGVEKKRVR